MKFNDSFSDFVVSLSYLRPSVQPICLRYRILLPCFLSAIIVFHLAGTVLMAADRLHRSVHFDDCCQPTKHFYRYERILCYIVFVCMFMSWFAFVRPK